MVALAASLKAKFNQTGNNIFISVDQEMLITVLFLYPTRPWLYMKDPVYLLSAGEDYQVIYYFTLSIPIG